MKILLCLLASSLFLTSLAAPVIAQPQKSQEWATELAKRLSGDAPQAFAAAVPDDETRYVAVLHIPNVQLLAISATYASPALLRELLLKGDYQRVYRDLNSAGDREGRFFVEDLGADGLRPDRAPNAAFDITWRDGGKRTLFNGDWKGQKLSESEYRERFEKDAAQYAEMLRMLLDAYAARQTVQP